MTSNEITGFAKPPSSTQFKPGQSGNPGGRLKGSRNRATLVKWLLTLPPEQVLPESIQAMMKIRFPELGEGSIEEMMHMAQIYKAIVQRDTRAYLALMDAAYGRPARSIEHSGPEGGPIQSESKGARNWVILDYTKEQSVPKADEGS